MKLHLPINMLFVGLVLSVAFVQDVAQAEGLQKCGFSYINPFRAICCTGLIYVRAGVKPACCGHLAYDAFHYLCCDGKLHRKRIPGNAVKCCSAKTFDVRKAVCHNGQVVHRPFKAAATGSTCCIGENGWACCKREDNCCASVGSGSLDIPGFRPVCCHIMSTSVKAQCCSRAAQKSGAIPECCNSPRVKPICCETAANTQKCCEPTIGFASCCSNIPHNAHTPNTAPGPILVPVNYQETDMCCQSPEPQKHCCKSAPNQRSNYQVTTYQTTQTCCTPKCCAETSYVSACCRKNRASCCSVSSFEQRVECCSQPGLNPTCCPGQPKASHWRRTHHQKTSVNPPRKTYETFTPNPGSYDKWNIDRPQLPIPDSSPLSCCRASDAESCCTSGLQRSGGHPLCCPVTEHNFAPNLDNSANEPQYHTGGSTSHVSDATQHWTSERDDLENLLRSEDLQTLTTENKIPSKQNTYSHRNPLLGKRQVICSGVPYDTSQFICCSGELQVKLGSQPACCGKSSFDQATQTCCNGVVRYSCPVGDFKND